MTQEDLKLLASLERLEAVAEGWFTWLQQNREFIDHLRQRLHQAATERETVTFEPHEAALLAGLASSVSICREIAETKLEHFA